MKHFLAIMISVIMAAALSGTVFAETPEAQPQAGLAGGWQIYRTEEIQAPEEEQTAADENAPGVLPEEVEKAFTKALEGRVGMTFTPVAYLGSQVVAGTNYQILCIGSPVVPSPAYALCVVTVYEDLNGEASVLYVADFKLEKIEEKEDAQAQTQVLAGGWQVPGEIEESVLPEDAAAAYSGAVTGLLGVDYVPAALLGTKVIAGTEYAILVHATMVTAEPVSYFAVLFAAANADGTYELMKIVPLDLADFIQH